MPQSQDLESIVSQMLKAELQNFRSEIEKTTEKNKQDFKDQIETSFRAVTQEMANIFADNPYAKATSMALGTALGNAISGKKINARSIALTAAQNLRPVFDDFFKRSSSQIGDELRGIISLSDRNL